MCWSIPAGLAHCVQGALFALEHRAVTMYVNFTSSLELANPKSKFQKKKKKKEALYMTRGYENHTKGHAFIKRVCQKIQDKSCAELQVHCQRKGNENVRKKICHAEI
jgi:hypothetical protein